MIRRAACALAAVWMACATSWAGEPVTYIDENGEEQTLQPGDYTVLTGDEPVTDGKIQLAGGTYVVNSDVAYQYQVYFTNDNAMLILANGANMTIQPIQDSSNIKSSGALTICGEKDNPGTLTLRPYSDSYIAIAANLTVNGGNIIAYGEVLLYKNFTLNGGSFTVNKDESGRGYLEFSDDTDDTINGGTLTVNGNEYGISCKTVTINGGEVNLTATATTGSYSSGLWCSGFTMSGGVVNATGYQYGIRTGAFRFSGGQLTANVAEGSEWANSAGLYARASNVYIYYSHASDFIKVSSYSFPVSPFKIIFGPDNNNPGCYTFVDETDPTTEFTGVYNSNDNADAFDAILAAMAGKKLVPKVCTVTLRDGVYASGDDVTTVGDEVKAVVALPVTLTTPGYENVSLTVKDANNQEVTLTDGTFTMPNSDATVTGSMTPIVYHITYDLSGGTVATANPATYTVESATFTLNNPAIPGVDFLGWTGTDLDDLTTTVTIAKGSIGDRSYKAKFDAMTLQDGMAYTLTNDAEVKAAIYVKTLGSARTGKFQAWLVPFDHAITEADAAKFTFYKINMIANAPNPETEASDEMWVFLKKMSQDDVLHANMPYVFKPKEDLESYAFTTPNATLKAKNTGVLATMQTMEDTYTLYATYENTTATSVDPFYYVNIDGELSLGNDGTVTVGAYRWIMRVESKSGSTPAYARKMHFYDGGSTPTGISPAEIADCNATLSKREMAEMAGAWYTLDGRKFDTKPTTKGVYVVNGKKFVIK